MRAGIGVQRAPVCDRTVPVLAARRERATLHVVEGLVVDCDEPGAGTGLDRHVAHRHATFHAQRADRAAGELDGAAGAAGDADRADEGQRDILGADACGE